MSDLANGLILTTLVLLAIGCQSQDSPATVTLDRPSPAPTPALEVTFATLTPAPTTTRLSKANALDSSVTPTATATTAVRYYIIQAGDTMVGIAAANGLTLDDLMALNPDVSPELLLVGQQIALPPSPTAVPPAPDSAEQLLTVEIVGLTTYRSATGGIWLLGEIRNVGSRPVGLIQVEVTLTNQAEQAMARKTLWVTPVTLPVGGRAPFGSLFPQVEDQWVKAEAVVVSGRLINDLGNRYQDLATTDTKVTIGRNPVEVTGQIENVGEQSAGQVSLITTFYDDANVITGFHELLLDGTLDPGESRPFHFIALPPGGGAYRHEIVTQAVVADQATE